MIDLLYSYRETVVYCASVIANRRYQDQDPSSHSCSANSTINNETKRFLFDGLALSPVL